MDFERNIDVKKALQIGIRNKRVFKDIEDVAQWIYQWPDVISEGYFSTWEDEKKVKLPVYSEGKYLPEVPHSWGSNLLQMVKWIKSNIHIEPYPQHTIGLKDSKAIIDRTLEILKENEN